MRASKLKRRMATFRFAAPTSPGPSRRASSMGRRPSNARPISTSSPVRRRNRTIRRSRSAMTRFTWRTSSSNTAIRSRNRSASSTRRPRASISSPVPPAATRSLLSYSKSTRTWSAPLPVSAPKQDIMRAAVAVDGQKRVWVFWSAFKSGNFDIYAKVLTGGSGPARSG